MFDWLKTLPNWLKLKPRHFLGVAMVCFIIVILPEPLRKFLGYDDLISPYRGWFSLAGLAFAVYGFVMLIACLQPWLLGKLEEQKLRKSAPKILKKLSAEEKSYIARYIKQNTSSLDFRISDGTIKGLEAKDIVYCATQISVSFDYFAFNLQPWVLDSLDTNPDLKKDMLKYLDFRKGLEQV